MITDIRLILAIDLCAKLLGPSASGVTIEAAYAAGMMASRFVKTAEESELVLNAALAMLQTPNANKEGGK